MIKKDLDGYGTKYEAKFRIISKIKFSGGQNFRFLQDTAHILKFCEVYQILRSQNPGGTDITNTLR